MSSSSSSSSDSDADTMPSAPLLKPQYQHNDGYGGIQEQPTVTPHTQIIGQSSHSRGTKRKIFGLSVGVFIAILAAIYCVTVCLPILGTIIYFVVAIAVLGEYDFDDEDY
eukprot:CAMPEP_0174261852 /NCGR_PEP_ID=MMETSP0439-20130205/12505_1 /TAXON_ID=0 /ORGANISM="Stereomyxa ramosa, Strain Chinc5" /LENGTH=109 /DNA_ID=CAMNT_0015346451 /DNA_START=59 /DNA_END=388 /DNA_ORIENTATION=-